MGRPPILNPSKIYFISAKYVAMTKSNPQDTGVEETKRFQSSHCVVSSTSPMSKPGICNRIGGKGGKVNRIR